MLDRDEPESGPVEPVAARKPLNPGLGTGAQAFYYGRSLPAGEAAKDPAHWTVWPGAMIPVAVIGLLLCVTIWNARPRPNAAALR